MRFCRAAVSIRKHNTPASISYLPMTMNTNTALKCHMCHTSPWDSGLSASRSEAATGHVHESAGKNLVGSAMTQTPDTAARACWIFSLG